MAGQTAAARVYLFTLVLVAGILRLGYVTYLPGQAQDLLHSDMVVYDKSGWAMSQGEPITGYTGFNGYHPLSASTYYHAGYTYFVAGVYAIFGRKLEILCLIQGLIGTLTIALVYLVGAKSFGRLSGLIAATLTTFYLPLVYYHGLLLTETWFVFLQMAALVGWLQAWGAPVSSSSPVAEIDIPLPALSWVRPTQTTSLSWAFFAGLLAGAACTTRSAFLPAVGTLALGGLVIYRGSILWKRRVALSALFILGATVVIAPITVRNFQIHDRFILLSTNGPSTFYTGHVSHTPFIPDDFAPGTTDAEMADRHRRESLKYLKLHWPTYLAELPEFFNQIWLHSEFWPNTSTIWRFEPVHDPDRSTRVQVLIDEPGAPPFGRLTYFPDLVRYVDRTLWLLVGLPAGLVSFLFLPRNHRYWLGVYLALVPYLIIPFIASPFPRYRIPAAPLVFVLAGQTLCVLWQCRSHWRTVFVQGPAHTGRPLQSTQL